MESVGVGLEQNRAFFCGYGELIKLPCADVGNEAFPNAAVADLFHGVCTGVPVVPAAADGDGGGVWRPHAEHHAGNAPDFSYMRPEELI